MWVSLLLCCSMGAQSPWLGEWGEFHLVHPHTYEGAGITISNCTGNDCSFSIAVQSHGHGDASGVLVVKSATDAVAHLTAFKEEHCTLELSRSTKEPAIRVTAGTGDCSYFQTPGVTFLGTFPLRTRDVFVSDHTAECFASSEAPRVALCRNTELVKALEHWSNLFLEVSNLTKQTNTNFAAARNDAEDRIVDSCSNKVETDTCLARGLADETHRLSTQRDAWIKSVTDTGDAVQATKMANAIRGKYSHRFRNGDVDGDKFFSTDELTIDVIPGSRIHYDLNLYFFNGHQCSLEGTASWRSRGFFVDQRKVERADASSDDPLQSLCVFEIRPTATGVEFADPTGICRQTSCGARGGYGGAKFSFKERRLPVSPSPRNSKSSARKSLQTGCN